MSGALGFLLQSFLPIGSQNLSVVRDDSAVPGELREAGRHSANAAIHQPNQLRSRVLGSRIVGVSWLLVANVAVRGRIDHGQVVVGNVVRGAARCEGPVSTRLVHDISVGPRAIDPVAVASPVDAIIDRIGPGIAPSVVGAGTQSFNEPNRVGCSIGDWRRRANYSARRRRLLRQHRRDSDAIQKYSDLFRRISGRFVFCPGIVYLEAKRNAQS